MKISTTAIDIISAIALFNAKPTLANTKSCLDSDSVDYNNDYFPFKATPKYSKYWDISYHNTYKIMTNKATSTTFLMYQCGTVPPAEETGKHNMTFAVPLQTGLILSSSTQVPQLEQLGLRRQIKGYLEYIDSVSSPCIQTLYSDGAITNIGKDGIDLAAFKYYNPETLLLRGYVAGDDAFYINEANEGENLAIYEWHKVYGALFNLEETANAQFSEMEARFDCASNNAAMIAQEKIDSGVEKKTPTVVWASWSNYEEVYYGREAYWDVARCDEKNLYYCDFAQRCSAELLHSNNGSIENSYSPGDYHMTDEEFFEFAKDADHWIYTSYNWNTVFDNFKDNLTEFKSVQNEEVFDTYGKGSAVWFEQRIAEADIVLQDFCEVVGHYDDSEFSHERQYLRKALPDGGEEASSLGTCEGSEVDIPWESDATQCANIIPNSSFAMRSIISVIMPLGAFTSLALLGMM